jgi:hypothetical protein
LSDLGFAGSSACHAYTDLDLIWYLALKWWQLFSHFVCFGVLEEPKKNTSATRSFSTHV